MEGTNENISNDDIFVVNGVANYSFVKGSSSNASTLSSLLGMFYKMGWYCKQWTEIKKYNESYKNISPFWRGIFYIGYASQFKKIVVELFEARTNMILQNDNVPQEEKDKWQKELKKLKSIFAKFSLQQEAINKIVPIGHPEGSSSKFASLLGLPVFVLLILIIFGFSIISALFNNCFEVEENVLKNTCENYSFAFPFNTQIGLATNNGFDFYCQESGKSYICMTQANLDNPKDFNLETLSTWEQNKILNKFTTQYAGNTTHCFKEEVENKQIDVVCYMQVKRPEPIYFIFGLNNTDNGEMENLEKLMHSYKNL
ncbi:MAG: hypothetical protein J5594_02880 [Elusimicrobiaceae bacterium]|nr:hypothetical protein [Elusimicrobiaceae bacterium]